ncbi:efflux RND transporter periplasmic adaptor subunit [Devosia salina]|uniref:Efflux RND transporter periplasmic adaptor subunit n=1 Tax=Devosia salina TaxID=2860336 RepID=A0ABX8WGY8_9HYPH|nr:efflux RND transporter periplasmic adaptor subunit [Devosia salina]QYO76266.1 efflux RND transporter periplasmic adaptor subunit [Devosia salina]
MASPSTKPGNQVTRRRKRRIGWTIVGLILIGAGSAYAYFERPWEEKPVRVEVEIAEPDKLIQALAVNGRVMARETIQVRSAVSGLAVSVGAGEGESVNANAVLVQLDTAQPQALLDQAQAALDAGLVRQQQAEANAARARALGENTPRSTREDAELALTEARNDVSRLAAALDQARSQLEQYTIRSPIDGVVLDRSIDRGQLVDTQSNLYTVADLSELLVETNVDELYSSRISNGLDVLLRPAGNSVAQEGTIVFTSPKVDTATGGRAIRIAFDTPVDLPVGLTVNANIIVSEIDAAISVPRGAILTEGTQSHVLLLEDGVVREQAIDFADWPAERVMVTDGIEPGDVVVLDPSSVAPGQLAVAE